MEEVIRMKVGNGQLAMSGRSEVRQRLGWANEAGSGWYHQGD